MTFKSRLVITAALALLLAPAALEAQRAGFIAAGIAPPATVVPVLPAPGQFAVAQPVPQWTPNWGQTGFIPAPPMITPPVVIQFNQFNQFNGPVVVTQQTVRSPRGHAYPSNVVIPVIGPGVAIVQAPISTFGAPAPAQAVRMPLSGTPRADVLRTLGQPTAIRITRDREVLYFNGGVTVLIENGQVSGPK